ncbi:hypothetical protein RA876_09325 [Rhodoferax antarcticus]|nr:glycosyltransferase [Rhodoferax antarcticus]APW46537.1 hypothetical protein RA876_09325 [Rhodoferax antarcticus]
MKKIAVITRTKSRNLLLKRCLESLLRQTYKNITWVIVNDNGDIKGVEIIATEARMAGLDTKVINREISKGVAAAANNGIKDSESELIHIHDDDDTIEPSFYEEVVSYLDAKPHYMGVVTCTNRIDEEIVNNKVFIIDNYKYYHLDGSIYISDLVWKNQFSPISFVYRRCVFDFIDLYDESLPVLEDWDFNLRFAIKYDIGAISKFLANYHWRINSNTGGMTQTVISGSGLHQEYTAVIRNKMLRQDLENGKSGLGLLMSLGRFQQLQVNSIKLVDDKVNASLFLRHFIKKIVHRVRR